MNSPTPSLTGARLLVRSLERLGVTTVFGIPGAKIDSVFNELVDSPIRLIVCRHEQNAVFMAAAHGRLTGRPGVVVVTSGPGVGNLTTGLLTATTEGDPVVAIGGAVARNMSLKSSHQNTDNTKILAPVTKSSVSVASADNIEEALANAFRTACAPRAGACFLSVPSDVLAESAPDIISCAMPLVRYGAAPADLLQEAARLLASARLPVILLGEEASAPENVPAIRDLIARHRIPVVCTFQGAGVVSRNLFAHFCGRVGLFKNRVGDELLDAADVVLTVGYDPVEYDPEIWNASRSRTIIHLDTVPGQVHATYQPRIEILGDIALNVAALSDSLHLDIPAASRSTIDALHAKLVSRLESRPASPSPAGLVHPLDFIHAFRAFVGDEDLVLCDVGTVYMWMARYFISFTPRQLLFSNGQQTLGVALPWAISARLLHPQKRIFSISGDGGFLFSSMELETAVREKTPFVHFIWSDGSYNMVKEQEIMKYERPSGVALGSIDVVAYAAAFGARGHRITSLDGFSDLLDSAVRSEVPVLIDVAIDYSSNPELFARVHESAAV